MALTTALRTIGALLILLTLSLAGIASAEVTGDTREIRTNERKEFHVLENDGLGDKGQITKITKPLNGEASVSADQKRIIYQPNKNFSGVDQIRYTATNGSGAPAEAPLTIAVKGLIDGLTTDQLTKASIILFQAFVLALLLETAAHLVFSYRWFIYYFEGRGVKIPIMIALSLAVVLILDYDLVKRLMAVFSPGETSPHIVGYVLTALILAGGTSTVYVLYRAIGLRPPASERAGPAFKKSEFARARITVSRSPQNEDKDLEIFINERLYGTLHAGQSAFPTSRTGSLPIPVDSTEFKVAVVSDYTGTQFWQRSLSVSKLETLDIHFDLTQPPPQKPNPQAAGS